MNTGPMLSSHQANLQSVPYESSRFGHRCVDTIRYPILNTQGRGNTGGSTSAIMYYVWCEFTKYLVYETSPPNTCWPGQWQGSRSAKVKGQNSTQGMSCRNMELVVETVTCLTHDVEGQVSVIRDSTSTGNTLSSLTGRTEPKREGARACGTRR